MKLIALFTTVLSLLATQVHAAEEPSLIASCQVIWVGQNTQTIAPLQLFEVPVYPIFDDSTPVLQSRLVTRTTGKYSLQVLLKVISGAPSMTATIYETSDEGLVTVLDRKEMSYSSGDFHMSLESTKYLSALFNYQRDYTQDSNSTFEYTELTHALVSCTF